MGDQIPRITAADGVTVSPLPGGTETAMAQKTPDTAQTFPTVEPDLGKGVTVQAEPNGAPAKPSFMLSQDPDVTFKGLNARNTLLAQQMASSVKRNLTLLYNDKKLENPEAVAQLEFPEFPTTGNPGFFTKVFRQGMLGMQYNGALSDYEVVCTDLLNSVGRTTIVEEVRAVGDKVDDVKEIALADLAADLNMEQELLLGLSQVYSMIDFGTHQILAGIDNSRNAVIRCIDGNTGKITDLICKESTNIQDLESKILKQIGIESGNISSEIKNAYTNLNKKIQDEGQDTRQTVRTEGLYTRMFVEEETVDIMDKMEEEHKLTRDVVRTNNLPLFNFIDPFGIFRNRFGR